MINEAANQAALYRTKEVFRALGHADGNVFSGTQILDSYGAGDRARWRFAFRSGPYAHGLGVIVGMVEPNDGFDQNSYARLDIANSAGTVVASTTFVYGANPYGTSGTAGGWPGLKQIMGFVDGLDPDTEYFGTFYDVDYGRLQSACAFELATLSENGGYLAQNITTHSAILDIHRQFAAEVSNAVWQKGGAQVFNWTLDDGSSTYSTTSATYANVLNTSVTTVSAASPGWTLVMGGKARLSQASGVPVTMRVYASHSATGQGTTQLVDSSGATILSTTHGPGVTGWQAAQGFLPATTAKYDLQFATTAGTFSIYAASVYEYG